MEEEKKICAICGKEINEDEDYLENNKGEYLCEGCKDDGYDMCADCGEFTNDLTRIEDEDKYVCDDCLGDYHRCERCDNYYSDARETYDGNYVCDYCYDNYYNYCDQCGHAVRQDDSYWRDNECYCPDCYDNLPDEIVGDYHSHDIETYFNDDGQTYYASEFQGGYGFELEVANGREDKEYAASNVHDILGDHAYFEEDGSLDGRSFEIISLPHTRKAMEKLPMEEVMQSLKRDGYKSHDAGCCGLHIHVSRTLFGDTEEERTENIVKIILFYEAFWDDIVKVSRRKYFGYCHKMSDDRDIDTTDDKKLKEVVKDCDDGSYRYNRYNCINLCSEKTIEFRIMRGTLNIDTFWATLDFTMSLVENCKKIPMEQVTNKFLWLTGMKPETIKYIKKRGAFGFNNEEEENED